MSDFNFIDNNHGQVLLQGLNELRQSQRCCDIILKVSATHEGFPAHSQVLTATSRYFKNICEKSNERGKEFVLDDIKESVLEIVLQYIYTGTVIITSKNVQDIFKVSLLFELESLKQACIKYMENVITRDNCLQFMFIGTKHECPALVEKTREHIAKHFADFVVEDDFSKMEAKELKAIISSDCLIVKNENEVYQAVKMWIEHDLSHRLKYIPFLLSHVRFRFLPRDFLKKTYTRDPIMMTSLLAQDFIHEALIFETLPFNEQQNVHTSRVKPRWCSQSLDVISLLGGNNSEDQKSVTDHWVFDPVHNQWYTASPLLSPRHHFGVSRHDNELYLFGGALSEGCETLLSTVDVYDPKLNQWRSATKKMKQERSRFDAVITGEIIHFVGGMCCDPHRNTLEKYFVEEKTSKRDLNLDHFSLPKQPRYDHCTAVVDGNIFLIGGCTRGHSALQTVECYNAQLNTWCNIAPLLVPRSGACAVVLNNCIVVIGGSNKKKPLSSCEIYDLNKELWEYVPSMNERRDHCSAVVFKEKIYVFGGSYGQVTQNSVECYSIKLNKWKVVSHLPASRHGFKCISSVANRSLVQKICFEQV